MYALKKGVDEATSYSREKTTAQKMITTKTPATIANILTMQLFILRLATDIRSRWIIQTGIYVSQ